MKETRADTTRALLYALALHLLLFALAFLGLWWTRETVPVSAAGSPIEADLVDPNALSRSMRRAMSAPATAPPQAKPQPVEEAAPTPQPLPEPKPQDSPVPQQSQAQERVPVPDTINQERVDPDAISADVRADAQEAKFRQEQIDLTEQQRQAQAQKKQRLSPMEQERLQQLADIRNQRVAATHDAKIAEARLKQLADYQARNAAEAATQADAEASASPPPGNEGVDAGLAARYAAALQEAILRNWVRPDSVPLGQRCDIEIRQLPGGEVMDVKVSANCPYDDLGKRSVEAAVLKAQPLPYTGFEKVFQRRLDLHFRAQEQQ